MIFQEGQKVKFKNEEQYRGRVDYTDSTFKQNVLFGDTFIVRGERAPGYTDLITKNGYKFDCKNSRLVLVSTFLDEAEEL